TPFVGQLPVNGCPVLRLSVVLASGSCPTRPVRTLQRRLVGSLFAELDTLCDVLELGTRLVQGVHSSGEPGVPTLEVGQQPLALFERLDMPGLQWPLTGHLS